MARILNEDRKYNRIRPSINEKTELARNGLQWTLSSFISAIGFEDQDLIIRFKNGSIYKYSNSADLYDNFLRANSKGKFFWRNILKRNIKGVKTGTMPLSSDLELSDDELFETIEEDVINNITKELSDNKPERKITLDPYTGMNLLEIIVGGIVIYSVLQK
jgi:hypothetical protein